MPNADPARARLVSELPLDHIRNIAGAVIGCPDPDSGEGTADDPAVGGG